MTKIQLPHARRIPWAGIRTSRALVIVGGLLGACAPALGPPVGGTGDGAVATPTLPPVPEVIGDLRVDVVHPPAGALVAAAESTFIFGDVGRGDAVLTIDGATVEVAPNGAWLAFLPIPVDGTYRIEAAAADQRVVVEHTIRRPTPASIEDGRPRIFEGSASPTGAISGVRGERIEFRVRGTAGGLARLLLPNGTEVPLLERAALDRAIGFMLDETRQAEELSEYFGSFRLEDVIATRDPSLPVPTLLDPGRYEAARAALTVGGPVVELTRGEETVVFPVNLSIGVLAEGMPRVAVAATARADSTVIGRRALGADQAWDFFWPNGTLFAVDGEAQGFYRVRLGRDLTAWVASSDVRLLPEGAPPPAGVVGPSIQLSRNDEGVDVRFSLLTPIPFRIVPSEYGLSVEFYGATGQPAYVGNAPGDDFVREIAWDQPSDGLFRFDVHLNDPLWGFHSYREGSALVVRVRRPPSIDPANPLRGLRIGVDAGHAASATDTGATGPTRLTEAEATANIAERLIEQLRALGAEPIEVRPRGDYVPLIDRPILALRENFDLMVSIHFNAFPDGVNPFRSHGTTMFYYWPQSLGLARRLQEEIVGTLGLPDRGVRFQNLGMPRTTWMPSVLTESAYLMLPEQESALRDPEVQDRLAGAHLRAIAAFVRDVAAHGSVGAGAAGP